MKKLKNVLPETIQKIDGKLQIQFSGILEKIKNILENFGFYHIEASITIYLNKNIIYSNKKGSITITAYKKTQDAFKHNQAVKKALKTFGFEDICITVTDCNKPNAWMCIEGAYDPVMSGVANV